MMIALGKPQAIISEETAAETEANINGRKESPRIRSIESHDDSVPRALSTKDGNNTSKKCLTKPSCY